MMNRRKFVKQASLAVAALGAGGSAGASAGGDERQSGSRKGREPY